MIIDRGDKQLTFNNVTKMSLEAKINTLIQMLPGIKNFVYNQGGLIITLSVDGIEKLDDLSNISEYIDFFYDMEFANKLNVNIDGWEFQAIVSNYSFKIDKGEFIFRWHLEFLLGNVE